MEERKQISEKKHSVNIENRNRLALSGVTQVGSFDEETIRLMTELGGLTIQGKNMHINKLNVDDGNLIIEGTINSCTYSDRIETANKGSLLTRMFK